MKKLDAMAKQLNDEFRNDLAAEMKQRFDIEIETHFNIFSMNLTSTRTDGQDFTPEQMAFMKAYEAGYLAAMMRVRQEAQS